jgi:hypothetical protein
MLRVSESTTIARVPQEIFDIAADPHTQLKWDPATLKQVEKLSPGPLAQGARYRGEFKGFGIVEYEFAVYEPGKRFAHHAMMKIGDMQHIFEFEAVPEGTRLTQTLLVEPKGIGKLLAPIMPMMLRGRLRTINAEISAYVTSPGQSSAQQ